ncbi:CBS domain-containing protein [Allosphingosinicella flava]|uniref:CBS domain-containing protein n=1 Tax=Allosphingosinicella flava TaxID=2771430 RepID=A0A7T2LLX5_9SPHN|nr:CBS domain-containing protein [Sphingosinicella flava]QPQ54956.1 CBS domain-containing protein [Sphingosinicella flava]
MKVRNIMTPSVETISPTHTIADAAKMMGEMDVGALPVVDDGMLVGMITDRDIAIRGVGGGLHHGAPVLRVMSEDVETCREDDDLDDVLDRMGQEQVRRMPVTAKDGGLIGIVSISDAAREGDDEEEVGEALSSIARPSGRHCQTILA